MAQNRSRRNFLRSAPLVVAAASLPLGEKRLFASAPAGVPEPYKVFSAEMLMESVAKLRAMPGNDNLYESKALPITMVLTTEEKKNAKEFEYHEGRDHIFQILDGTTSYELGGTPVNPRKTKPGEWMAPGSEGSRTVTVHKGDMLLIPRGTPHKRSTETSVTFMLISVTGSMPA